MRKMGRYCKAYPIQKLREFPGWSENAANARKEKKQEDGKEVEVARELTDADHLYLQEDYTVTDGIFMEENVIFDNVTPEWKDFSTNTLNFEVPAYEAAASGAETSQAESA
jgi:hypothetical protein